MNGNPRNGTAIVGLLALAVMVVALWAMGQGGGLVLPQDKGPDKVDISAYPSNIQEYYRVYERQCGKCHTLARSINTSMPAVYWANYLGTAIKKPEYGITLAEADQIYQFLALDQVLRKGKRPKGLYPALTEDELQALRQQQGK
jgi:mono/diheme cytochrome c family protein